MRDIAQRHELGYYSPKILRMLSFNDGVLLALLSDLCPMTPNSLVTRRFSERSTSLTSSYIAWVSRGEWENEKMLNACGADGAVGKRAND